MRTVIIVDDETLVRVGMLSLIDWESHGYKVLGTFSNGSEALNAIEKCIPDVLLTDIKMPVMDGIELIQNVKKICNINIVILSNYDDFEYTRQAMKLGVKDYILKNTIEPDKIIETLNSLEYTGKSDRSSAINSLAAEKEYVISLTEASIGEKFDIDKIPNLHNRLSMMGRHYCWLAVRHVYSSKEYGETELKAFEYLVEDRFSRIANIEYMGSAERILYGIIGIDDERGGVSKTLNDITVLLIDDIREKIGIKTAVGVSCTINLDDKFPYARNSAMNALSHSFYRGEGVYYELNENELRAFTENEWLDFSKKVKEYLISYNIAGLRDWIMSLKAILYDRTKPQEVITLYRFILFQILDMVLRKSAENNEQKMKPNKIHTLSNKLENIYNYDKLVNYMDDIIRDMVTSQFKAHSTLISKIVDEIEKNYNSNISLDDLADLVNYNKNYLCELFHSETGYSIIEYLTNIRIGKAAELLRNTSLSTEQVASLVGYKNPNYFIKTFKKVTGCTVTEYKRNHNNF